MIIALHKVTGRIQNLKNNEYRPLDYRRKPTKMHKNR
jgi:hypothetical protein